MTKLRPLAPQSFPLVNVDLTPAQSEYAFELDRLVRTLEATSGSGGVPTTRLLTAGTGLTGGGDLSADRTFAVTYGTAAGTSAQGNDARIVGAAQTADLGTAAFEDSTAFDAAGTATTAIAAHVAAADPHPQYLTAAEGSAAYAPLSHVGAGGTAHANVVAAGASGFMTGVDKTKLDGVAAGATANSSDATLLNRANHTGTQAISTVSGLQTALDAKIAGPGTVVTNRLLKTSGTTGVVVAQTGITVDASDNITGAATIKTAGGGSGGATNTLSAFYAGQSGGGYGRAGYNVRFTGTANTYQYDLSDSAACIEYGKANGSFAGGLQVYTASAGTAGGTISFTAGPYVAVNGTSWTTPSDARLKENVKPITVLDRIEGFRAVTFDWKQSGLSDVGVIAQEVFEVFPEVVNTEGEYLGVDYAKLAALAMQAVKELAAKVAELESR